MRAIPLLVLLLLAATPAAAQISPGPLSRSHHDLEGVTNCTRCHEGAGVIGGSKCLECHTEITALQKREGSFHARQGSAACESCHKEHLGQDAAITRFTAGSFDHSQAGFALDGKHRSLECTACHTASFMVSASTRPRAVRKGRVSYLGLTSACQACHADKHNATLSGTCDQCHTTSTWTPASRFDHKGTDFALTGKHGAVGCVSCHTTFTKRDPMLTFGSQPFTDCTPCHTSPHRPGFSTQACRTCHTADGWSVSKGFDHSQTRFALEGKHNSVACAKCHSELGKKGSPGGPSFATKPFQDCSPCHSSPHRQRFTGQNCSSCHRPAGWDAIIEGQFTHDITGFPLRGRHVTVECAKCHTASGRAPTYATTYTHGRTACNGCHKDQHNGRFASLYANACQRCHTEEGFLPSTFSIRMHASAGFQLSGAHAAVPCSDCHRRSGSQTFLLDIDADRCDACHTDRHRGQFTEQMKDRSCAACHTAATWNVQAFDHSTTAFRLAGRHASVACERCHTTTLVGGSPMTRYRGTPMACTGCHSDIHAGQFAVNGVVTCETCHSPAGWHALAFRHDTHSRFALTGAHTTTPCRGCHKEEQIDTLRFVRYKPLATECASCHTGKL